MTVDSEGRIYRWYCASRKKVGKLMRQTQKLQETFGNIVAIVTTAVLARKNLEIVASETQIAKMIDRIRNV